MDSRIDKLLNFLREIEKLKIIERKIYTSKLERKESDAEHSWHLAMFLFIFKNDLPKELNFEKMLKLALMHDLVEIYSGDPFAFDKNARKGKKQRELEAADKLFSKLPSDLKDEFLGLFHDYIDLKSRESIFVNSFDKLQPTLQNLCSDGKSWKEHKLNYKKVDEYKREHLVHSDFIMKLYNKIMDEAKDRKLLQ